MSIKNMRPIVANFLVLVSVPIDCSCDIGRDAECLATLKPMVLDCFVVSLVFRLIQSKHAIQVNVSEMPDYFDVPAMKRYLTWKRIYLGLSRMPWRIHG